MLVCVAIIIVGASFIYISLMSADCGKCWRREREAIRTARLGLAIVIIGCILVCYQFWYWS